MHVLDSLEPVTGILCAVQAFHGADQLFLVTDFYGGAAGNPHTEVQHGKNAIDAAKKVSMSSATTELPTVVTEIIIQYKHALVMSAFITSTGQQLCMQAGVKFVVFSTLEHIPDDVRKAFPVIEDGMVIPHFESKAAIGMVLSLLVKMYVLDTL